MRISGRIKKLIAVILVMIISSSIFTVSSFAKAHETIGVTNSDAPKESYTYWEDYSSTDKTMAYSKPMYSAQLVINSSNLGTEPFNDIKDICSDEFNNVYLLDSGASKIYILNSEYKLEKTIDAIVYNDEVLNILGASGIFVKNKQIYVADTKNARVLVLDYDGNVIHNLALPESRLIPSDFNYSPIRIAVDSRDYMYIASDGSYYGALVYSPKMEFLGFYGANTVAVSTTDAISNMIKRLFSNDEKKAAAVLALPYQFNDFVVGPNDFIYTVTGYTGSSETGQSIGQVKKLNPGGRDVLGKEDFNFADSSNTLVKAQSLNAIDVDKDGFFYVLDSSYGRIFWYDDESNLMSVFGSIGNETQVGTFAFATALAVNGTDVIVSDSHGKTITVFAITPYGEAVRHAQIKTLNDDFEDTVDEWLAIIKQDVNNQLAYRGLAKAYYTLGDYSKALEYAKMGTDRETYANAFVKLRTNFLEKWFTVIILGAAVLIFALWLFVRFKRKRNIVLIKNEKFKVMTSSVFHPFESFRLVKEKGMGSVLIASVILALYYISSALKDTAAGFAFNKFDPSTYNSFYILLSTIGLVFLFVVANWLVCVLLGGIGKMKEIYIVTCYSLIPVIFSTVASLILTHVLSPDEYVFTVILQAICLMYTFFMLAIGIIKIHDYEFGKFVGTTIITIIAMLIIVFLIFLVLLLAQQMLGWLGTAYLELRYR